VLLSFKTSPKRGVANVRNRNPSAGAVATPFANFIVSPPAPDGQNAALDR
jgi:hypothetical protein